MRNKVKTNLKRASVSLLGLAIIYFLVLLHPNFLFAHSITYKQVTVYSDRDIDNYINAIIEDALTRIKKSELYDSSIHFKVYICNDLWRFGIFTQGNKYAGAVTHYHLTGNIFFRPCDIENNKIVPPKEWYFAENPFTFSDRPLSYYFAHEMTHKLQSDFTGCYDFSNPTWLTEGYADYIGKDGNFNFNENLKLWHNNAPELDPTKGLYRLYHLKIAYLLDKQKKSIKDIYRNIPNDKSLTEEIWELKDN
ncbi:MAG: hypothetical protein JNN28_17345 [Saprospiraceae bacterium]|nr:hypothetical protein [Saprospiraceae bacterium]